jgi:hypothetical protein
MTYLPWAYPVMNAASGMPDYRLATFVFQSIIAGILFLVLAGLFFSDRKKTHIPHGDITLLFLLIYSASQVLLDSTRYDSLYFRSNGFVSIVQVLCAAVLGVCVILISVRAARAKGVQRWMIGVWVLFAALFGLAGYMEYYVQRHGKLAFFSYSVMEHALVGILVLAIYLWRLTILSPVFSSSKFSRKKTSRKETVESSSEPIPETHSQFSSTEVPAKESIVSNKKSELIPDESLSPHPIDFSGYVLSDLTEGEKYPS